MVAEPLPAFAPTPSSVAELARHLPASERAHLEWFPQALRTSFVEPLRRASPAEFHARLDALTVDAVRTFLQLLDHLGVLAEHLTPGVMARAMERDDPQWLDLIQQRLEPIDAVAADDLCEAHEWLRAILSTTLITSGAALQDPGLAGHAGSHARRLERLGDEEIRRELVGETRAFFHGLLLTIAALDVLERGDVPETIGTWCALALSELLVVANALRAAGFPVPADIPRGRRASRHARRTSALVEFTPRVEVCPPGALARIVEVLHPEQVWLFGSRARGTAGPDSDWDLLVVVPDATPTPFDRDTWTALREVRRQRIEIVPMRRSDFEADRREFGTLAHVATTSGRRIHGS